MEVGNRSADVRPHRPEVVMCQENNRQTGAGDGPLPESSTAVPAVRVVSSPQPADTPDVSLLTGSDDVSLLTGSGDVNLLTGSCDNSHLAYPWGISLLMLSCDGSLLT